MSKHDEHSLFSRLKQFLQVEPQNKEQLIELLRDAHDRTLIDADTLAMMESVVGFAQLRVRDIMMPKKSMVAIPEHAARHEMIETITKSGHSRFPVTAEDDPEEVIGILHAKDLLRWQLDQKETDVDDLVRQATFVPESTRLDLLLRELRHNRNHMVMVVDEYGSVSGFVTIEDVIEQIIGNIEDEFDIEAEDCIKKHNDNDYILKGHAPIEEVNETLHTQFEATAFDTVGGMVMAAFGYLPRRGETIQIKDCEFKVLQADSRRIKLLACSKDFRDAAHAQ